MNDRKVSGSTQNLAINAIKFYFEQVLGLPKKTYWIDRPRKESKLPRIIREEEVLRMIAGAGNLKHKCIIALLYSSGIRRGELLSLRLQDISEDRNHIILRKSKGGKQHATQLSKHMAHALQHYLEQYKPNYWLLEGPGRK